MEINSIIQLREVNIVENYLPLTSEIIEKTTLFLNQFTTV